MKKIAAILLLIFTLVQAGPAFTPLFSTPASVFIVDEEKGEVKIESDKKDNKKDYSNFSQLVTQFSHQTDIGFHLAEKIHPSPCIEKVSPPPNFC